MKYREPKPETCLAAVLATETLPKNGEPIGNIYYRAARDAAALCSLGRKAQRLGEKRCNGVQRYDAKARLVLASWTEADEQAAERVAEKIKAEALAILEPYGATLVTVTGDPRGYCVKFKLASGRSNGMSGEWGV